MYRSTLVSFLICYALAKVAFAYVPAMLTTSAPELVRRQAFSSICGYYSADGQLKTIACRSGVPCQISTYAFASGAVAWCSYPVDVPITSIYPYGNYPIGGCSVGSACCLSASPSVGRYLFNGGSTIFLGCDSTRFEYTAFTSTPSSNLIPSTTSSSTPSTTSSSATTATPTTPPTPTPAPDPGPNTTAIVLIVVGGVVALIGIFVFLGFLLRVISIWLGSQNLQGQGSGYATSTPQFREDKTTPKRQLAVSIVGVCITAAGVAVSVYFGLHRNT